MSLDPKILESLDAVDRAFVTAPFPIHGLRTVVGDNPPTGLASLVDGRIIDATVAYGDPVERPVRTVVQVITTLKPEKVRPDRLLASEHHSRDLGPCQVSDGGPIGALIDGVRLIGERSETDSAWVGLFRIDGLGVVVSSVGWDPDEDMELVPIEDRPAYIRNWRNLIGF